MLESYGVCDVGLVRSANQDFILIDESLGLFVVADGMGGHSHGELASRLAGETLQHYIQASRDRFDVSWPFGYDFELSVDANRMTTGIRLANRYVWRQAEQNPKYAGMGTTIAGILVSDSHVVIANVGDSRVYRFRDGRLCQLSEDDTWIQGMISRGLILSDEAATHPMRNVLMQAAGSQEDVSVHIREELLEHGDIFLLSSDGMHGVVGDECMTGLLSLGLPLEHTASRLAQASRERGAPDNLSVVIVRYSDEIATGGIA